MPMCVCAKLLQSCLTLQCYDSSPPGSFLSMGLSRQGYWSQLPCPPPGDLPDPRVEPQSLPSPALAGGFFTTSATWEAQLSMSILIFMVTCELKHCVDV